MNKAVIVIDMPEHCDDCPFRVLWAKYHCVVTGKFCGDEQGFYSSLTKPSWCPLRPYEESIPIEWIEDYLQKYTDMAGEYMGKDNDIAMYGIIRLNIISELLSAWKHKDDPHEYFPYVKGEGWKRVVEDWEKENGRSE